MPNFDLNLSTRSFPAYRAIALVLEIVLALLILITGWQAYGFVRYSRMARVIRADEQNVRVDTESLGGHVAELEARLDLPESTAKLNQIGFLNGLIARKELSWTRLLARLEETLPDELGRVVHLVSLAPSFAANGTVILRLSVRGLSIEDVSQFVHRLEQSTVFDQIIVDVEQKQDTGPSNEVDITLRANYYQQRETQ